jgi:hypothetical protein
LKPTSKGLEFTLPNGKGYNIPVSVGADSHTSTSKTTVTKNGTAVVTNSNALTEEEGMFLGGMLCVAAMGAGALAARGVVAVAPYVATKLLPMYNKLAATPGGRKVLNTFGKDTPAQQATMRKLMEEQVAKTNLDVPSVVRNAGPKLNIPRPVGKATPAPKQLQLPRSPEVISVPRGGFNNPNVLNPRGPLLK